jgi:2,3-bisphosphoglycerate-dependent phosphoglycerate mutase
MFKFYFSIIFLAIFVSCKNNSDINPKADLSPNVTVDTAILGSISIIDTIIGLQDGKISTLGGKTLAVPFYGDKSAMIFFMMRHTETDKKGGGEPTLSDAGKERARRFGKLVKGSRIDAIASTNIKRAMQTADEIYHLVGGPPMLTFPPEMQHQWYDNLVQEGLGKTYVYVGHSNTIPSFLTMLGIKEPLVISEENYSEFIVVGVKDGKAEMLRFTYQ